MAVIGGIAGDPDFKDDFAAQLVAIGKQAKEWSDRCVTPKSLRKNVKRYLEDHMKVFGIGGSAYETSAELLVFYLGAKWPWVNFTAICYAPLNGYDKHGWVTKGEPERLIAFKRHERPKGEKSNMIIYLAPRTRGKKPATLKTKDIKDLKSSKNPAIQARINGALLMSNVMNASKGGNAGYIPGDRDTRMGLNFYGFEVNPMDVTNWHGDLAWIGYREQALDTEFTGPDTFFGIAS